MQFTISCVDLEAYWISRKRKRAYELSSVCTYAHSRNMYM